MVANPFTSKPVKVTISDTSGSLLEGAKVYAYNTNNNEWSTETQITNSSGIVNMDMANFKTNGYADGDKIQFLVQETSSTNIEGQDVVDKIAREIIREIKANIKNHTGTKNVMFYNGLLANTPEPYDEIHELFKRRVELNFKAINIGEV